MERRLDRIKARLAETARFPLAHLPTPLEVSACAPGGHRLYLKRDDCTGFALGGNKSRKLEFTIGDALSKGATALVTASGVQSNHVRQTAAAAAKAGLRFHAIVTPALERFPRAHLESGNVLLDALFGAEMYLALDEQEVERLTIEIVARLQAEGERPYFIPLGASDGIGSLGYVSCAFELLDQIEAAGADISHLFVPTGSGGTHGGLLAGLRLAGSGIKLVGISVSEPADIKRQRVEDSIAGIEAVLGCGPIPVEAADILVFDDYAGQGYAYPTASANRWLKEVARRDGMLLDPIYTAKAFAGMADLLERAALGKVQEVAFLHTGGTAALFADPLLLLDVQENAPALLPLYARVTDAAEQQVEAPSS